MNPGQPVPPPRPGYFYEPTDVAWDAQGNIFISDGYQNSTVHKFDKDGNIVKVVGTTRGSGPGSSARRTALRSTPRATSTWPIVPTTASRCSTTISTTCARSATTQPSAFGRLGLADSRFRQALRRPLQHAVAEHAVHHARADAVHLRRTRCSRGEVQKFTLDGKLVGQFGAAGRKPGQFGWVHAISCVVGKRDLDRRAAQLARAEVHSSSRTNDQEHLGTAVITLMQTPPLSDADRLAIPTRNAGFQEGVDRRLSAKDNTRRADALKPSRSD